MSAFSRFWNSLTGKATPAENQQAGSSAKPEQKKPTGKERRRLQRVNVLSALTGYDVDAEASVSIMEISRGGFSLEGRVTFVVGSEHTFLFSAGDAETMVRCVCRHARPARVKGESGCIAGFEFLPGQESSLELIIEVFERLRRRK